MEIINKINKYSAEKNKEINKIINIKEDYTIKFNKNLLNLTNSFNKKILTSEYIFFGIYQSTTKLWIWSSSIPGVNKKELDKIKSIKNKSFMFEKDNDKKILFIYQLLTNDVIEINDNGLLNVINDTLLYLTNSNYILKPINIYGNVQYIGVTKIIEKYY
jgi:hypothetical protein